MVRRLEASACRCSGRGQSPPRALAVCAARGSANCAGLAGALSGYGRCRASDTGRSSGRRPAFSRLQQPHHVGYPHRNANDAATGTETARILPHRNGGGLPAPERAEGRAEKTPRKVREYLERLPEPQRVALVLRYTLDYSIGDIAKATECPPDDRQVSTEGGARQDAAPDPAGSGSPRAA